MDKSHIEIMVMNMQIKNYISRVITTCYGKIMRIPNSYISGVLLRSFVKDYFSSRYPFWKTFKIHRRGFTASDWAFLGLDKRDYRKYLSNVQYYRMHPLNGNYSYIIDSKLSLKSNCINTPIDQYLPKYYYRITATGKLEALSDCNLPHSELPEWHDLISCLKENKILAVKRNTGSIGEGFYRCEYSNGSYYANGKPMNNPIDFFSSLRDYLITEFLLPHKDIAAVCPSTANAIRYLAGRMNGKLVYFKGYIRFGTQYSGYVENYNAGGVLCYLDENGIFTEGNIIDPITKKIQLLKLTRIQK